MVIMMYMLKEVDEGGGEVRGGRVGGGEEGVEEGGMLRGMIIGREEVIRCGGGERGEFILYVVIMGCVRRVEMVGGEFVEGWVCIFYGFWDGSVFD